MSLFAAGVAELIGLLFVLFVYFIQALIKYLAEQKKKQEVKTLHLREVYGTVLAEEELQESLEPVLAEASGIVYDSESLGDVSVKNKKTPKNRSKSNRKKMV